MNSTAPHLEFAPPRTGGILGALMLAVLAHIVLLVALTLGVQWKSDPVQQTFEAELWSSVPTEAAPPPPPPPTPEPEVKPEPKPVEPVVKPDAALKAQADIALAKEKERIKELKRQEQEKQMKLEQQKKLEQDKQRKAEAEKDKQDKLKKEQADKDKQTKLDQQRKQTQQDQANAAKDRADQMKRLEKLAGATGNGAPSSTGTAAQSSGPSASYAGKIIARIKPNITYPDDVTGNPRTEVEIRVAPNGTILSKRVTQSSGIKSWDDAVLRAIDKTETLPRDTDGTVPSMLVMGFKPKD